MRSGQRTALLTELLILAAAAGAFAFRVPRLDLRPMHTDEAVHTVKAGTLIETGKYTYDPHEYHGPTIYYFALPFVWLTGAKTLAETDEATFRIVPAILGTVLVLLLLSIAGGLGRWEAVVAGALTAVSPAMVFYSRYYIQEIPLVCFTFGVIAFVWRYIQTKHLVWAVLAGACAGLMHATKETCAITFAAMAGSFVAVFVWARWRDAFTIDYRRVFEKRHVAIGGVTALLVSVLLLSGLFTNPRGALDAWLTYANYLHRAGGVGIHDHPWHYYLKMLIYTKDAPGPWWSEGLIVGLAAIGAASALLRKPGPGAAAVRVRSCAFVRFIAFYTILMIAAYSAIPYKTPWCMLSFLHGMILLAGIGAVAVIRRTPTIPVKAVVCVLLILAGWQLGRQAYRANFKYCADTRNPYVYGHTSSNLLRFAQQAEEIALVHPAGRGMPMKVMASGSDYWPLPWYLRRFESVGYWDAVPGDPDAAVIVTSPDLQEGLDARLKDSYQTQYFGLRPEVLVMVYVEQDLWDAFVASR